MLLTPRYGTDPVMVLDGDPPAIAAPAIRQRRRLVESLGHLTDEQWAAPSRCAEWTVRDVVTHLAGTNGFWEFTTQQALAGQPTTMLATFDPVATPAAMVAGDDGSPDAVLASLMASTERLAQLWASIDDDGWRRPGEAPPGHVSISAVTHHALWDSWIHERDVFVPLGIEPEREADEIAMSLRYAVGLGPALAVTRGSERCGRFVVQVTQPDVDITVDIGDCVRIADGAVDGAFTLSGDAVEMLEAFSFRAPLARTVPADHAWMFAGLAEVFETDGW